MEQQTGNVNHMEQQTQWNSKLNGTANLMEQHAFLSYYNNPRVMYDVTIAEQSDIVFKSHKHLV